jgi:hypothetical protein
MRTLFLVAGKTAGGLLASAVLTFSLSTVTHAATSIYGTPTTTVKENWYYGFQSWATDTDHRVVTYSIKNKPAWATFNTQYGHLYGIPTAADVGTYKDIVISASDGVSSASLPAFSLTVTGTGTTSSGGSSGGSSGSGSGTGTTGSATVNWTPPTTNTNGSTITNLAGYTLSYGTSSKSLTNTVKVNIGLTSYTVTDLAPGTYYFGVVAYNSAGEQSTLSNLASKTIK